MSARMHKLTALGLSVALALAVLVVLFWMAGDVRASPPAQGPETPLLINYQGYLTDDSGQPLTATLNMTFTLWGQASGGSELWQEASKPVSVANGLFNTVLGDQTALSTDVFTNTELWLGVQVGGDAEMTPRQRWVSAPYAIGARDADTLDDYHSAFWSLTGNAGTTPGTNFVGTTDAVSLTLAVDGDAALRLGPHATSPNVIGGYKDNSVMAGLYGATIGGGGASGATNRVTGIYGTVGGGSGNEVSNSYATVGGGGSNTASAIYATVGGGSGNEVSNSYATVGGGQSNKAITGTHTTVGGGQQNTASADYAIVGGGWQNTASDRYATVGGGDQNFASAWYPTVGGGVYNTANGYASTVGGGYDNEASGADATVGGGVYNTAVGGVATVGGGYGNEASGDYATVGGGYDNEANIYATVGGGVGNTASVQYATAGGGQSNKAITGTHTTVGGGVGNKASAQHATVPGGRSNTADGDYSFAAGRRAKANHQGAFVWGDSTDADINSPASNTFIVRANGGFWFGQSTINFTPTLSATAFISTSTGAYLDTNGTWYDTSDRNAKENFVPVDGQEVLARLAEMPITTWNFKADDPSVHHIGPVAQDFYAAFGLGRDDTHLSALDTSGVALAAIQELYQRSQEQTARIQALEAENAAQRQRLDAYQGTITTLQQQNAELEARLAALEALMAGKEGR